jgi:hypothetical protein
MSKQSLDTKLMRTGAAMERCDDDQPIDLCHLITIREARDELARLACENEELRAKIAAYRKARVVNGMCGRGWDSGQHMDAERELHKMGEPGSTQWHLDGDAIRTTPGGPNA